jgi:hypothetical protein
MKTAMQNHKWLVSCSALLLAALLGFLGMIHPRSSRAADNMADMQAFMFPPVSVNAAQSLLLCGSDMGEIAISGQIGLLDASDTTKSLVSMPFSLKPNTGSCTPLPTGLGGFEAQGTAANVIAYVAFPASTTWNSTSGKAFVASLQVREGNNTRYALAPTFLPAVPIPQSTASQ